MRGRRGISYMAAEKKRFIEFDIMRILACFGVIMIHAAVFGQDGLYASNTWEYQWIKIWGILSRWAVPAFVMLSGMMILPKADETTALKLMKHRVIRMLAVYIAWSAVYSAYNVFVLDIVYAPTKLKTFIDGCFSGETHMWYILMQAGLYIASPVLAVLVQKLDGRWTCYYLAGLLMFSSLIPFLVKLNIPFLSTVVASFYNYMDLQFLGGWTLYFVLGYYIGKHPFARREKIAVYIAALVSFLYTFERTVFYCIRSGEAFGVLSYEYPNIVLMGVGIMVFFREEVGRIQFSEKWQKWIRTISGLTFGIYLSHILLLKIFYSLGIRIQMTYTAVSVPLVAVVVFIAGAVLTGLLHKVPVVGKYIA